MKKYSILVACMCVFGLMAAPAFAIQYCKDFAPNGQKSFEDEVTIDVGSTISFDVYINDVPTPPGTLITGGFWLVVDPSVSIVDVQVGDGNEIAGPWDSGFTTEVPDAGGPGTYMVAVGNFATVAPDGDGDIFCGRVTIQCMAQGDDNIVVSTIPGFDTVVGDTMVLDPSIAPNTITIHQVPPPPCACTSLSPAAVGLKSGESQQFTPQISGVCNPHNYSWSDTCTEGDVDMNGLFTAGAITADESCQVCVTDLANTNVGCCSDIDMQLVTCDGEIYDGGTCEEASPIDDPAYNRPGRRGMALTCDDIVDFCICTDCEGDLAPCLEWSVTPPGYAVIVENPDGSARLTVDSDACDALQADIVVLEVTVEDTCNNWSDTIVLELGKVVISVGDTTAHPGSQTAEVEVSLYNPTHYVRAVVAEIGTCDGTSDDNLTCTECFPDTDRALGFTCTANEMPNGRCRVALVSITDTIEPGSGPILTVMYDVGVGATSKDCVCLMAFDREVADQFNEQLCTCQKPGELCFKVCGDIFPRECPTCTGCGDGVVDLFDILEGIDIVLGIMTADDCQLNHGDVPNGMPPYCGDPAGTPNCASDGDIDIFDVLVIIDKALGKANCCDYCAFGQIF